MEAELFLPYLLAAPAWNLQPLFPNFQHDCRSLILIRMHGARFVMEVWTSITTMRGYVWPVVSILNATMLSETLSVIGPTGLASGRNGNGRAFCLRKALRIITSGTGDPESLGCCRGLCPAPRSSPSNCRGVPRTRSLLYPHSCCKHRCLGY